MSTKTFKLKVLAAATIAAFGVALAMPAAYAQDGPKGQGGPTGMQGHKGSGGPAQDVGGGGRGQGAGQGGPSADSDAKGPRYGGEGSKPTAGTQGGRPAWASQELTDIGRMNVARAPEAVLNRSLLNAVAELKTGDVYNVAFYDAALAILKNSATPLQDLKALLADPTTVRIDSPLANLAFYKSILTTGTIKDADGNVVWSVPDADRELAAALFIAMAADKTKEVTVPVVHAVDVIFEFPSEAGSTATINPDADQDERIALPAETVRLAVYEVHEGL
jgi:hypothetical protein